MKHHDIFESDVCKIFCSFFPVEFFKLFTPVHLSQIIGGNNKAYLIIFEGDYFVCQDLNIRGYNMVPPLEFTNEYPTPWKSIY